MILEILRLCFSSFRKTRRSIIDFAIHPLGEFSNFLFQVIYSNMQNKMIRVIIKKRFQVMYHIISLGSQQGQSLSFPLLSLWVALFGVGNTVCFFAAAAAVFASGVSAFVVFRIIVIVVKNERIRSMFLHWCMHAQQENVLLLTLFSEIVHHCVL